jgi:hypothetical protein
MNNLDSALTLLQQGCHIFSCAAGTKKPHRELAPNGYLSATNDPIEVRRIWTADPTANIGIACVTSGLLVIDYDPRHDQRNRLRTKVEKKR